MFGVNYSVYLFYVGRTFRATKALEDLRKSHRLGWETAPCCLPGPDQALGTGMFQTIAEGAFRDFERILNAGHGTGKKGGVGEIDNLKVWRV